MATIYQNFIDLADRLIRKRGRSVKIRRETGTTLVDPTKPELGVVPVVQDAPTFAVFAQVDGLELLVRLATGRETPVRSNIESEDDVVLVPAKGLPFEINLSHKLVDGDEVLEIRKVQKIAPGDAIVMYELSVGR